MALEVYLAAEATTAESALEGSVINLRLVFSSENFDLLRIGLECLLILELLTLIVVVIVFSNSLNFLLLLKLLPVRNEILNFLSICP